MESSGQKETARKDRQSYFSVPIFDVAVLCGKDLGLAAATTTGILHVGTDKGNELRLTDPSVSRHHLVLKASDQGLLVEDLSSTNGTFFGELDIIRAYLPNGADLSLGDSVIHVRTREGSIETRLEPDDHFGNLLGRSLEMRRIFPQLRRFAQSDATVLLTGETGCGKAVAAAAIHQASDRCDGPFVVVDCGALPHALAESEFFGHLEGSFTGATRDRDGAFAIAKGGTVFLDEIGELPLSLQPHLLRILESKTYRPVGSDATLHADVRVIAATNRKLRVEVNSNRFRSDLYYRLNVLHAELPPLRERQTDVALLARHFWAEFHRGSTLPRELEESLCSMSWPGNVRELRNAVHRASIVGFKAQPSESTTRSKSSFVSAKQRAVLEFERNYMSDLLTQTQGNLSEASRVSKMSRSHLRLVVRRAGLAVTDFSG